MQKNHNFTLLLHLQNSIYSTSMDVDNEYQAMIINNGETPISSK